jgi:SSS family solute:Na+ symporter
MKLSFWDFAIFAGYIVAILVIGYRLKDRMKTCAEFLGAGRSLPLWITGISFMAANLGSLEIVGHIGNGAKYGMMTNHFYWTGAIPPMVFLGLFMVRFYYSSGVRSVPEYLKHRYDSRSHVLNSLGFLVVTILMSGMNMYALAIICDQLLGWNFHFSILFSAGVVVVYTLLGGLRSSIYNEVLQFFLIVIGFLPLPIIGLIKVGGWSALLAKLPASHCHTWLGTGNAADNPMGVNWLTCILVMTFISGPSYWCCDYLLVQRALAAKDLETARKTPLFAAFPKMMFPLLVTVPGMIALALMPEALKENGQDNFNLALPALMNQFYPHGLLGLGFTALMASFMSGMAGNVTAFNTVWTSDIYETYLVKNRPDHHYLTVGRLATVVGTALSIAAAYIVAHFNNMMDYMNLIATVFIHPFFVIFLVGMCWKRATATGGFCGILAGITASLTQWVLYNTHHIKFSSPMAAAQNQTIWAGGAGLLTIIVVSYCTKAPSRESLVGLVWTRIREKGTSTVWYKSVWTMAAIVTVIFLVLNWVFR